MIRARYLEGDTLYEAFNKAKPKMRNLLNVIISSLQEWVNESAGKQVYSNVNAKIRSYTLNNRLVIDICITDWVDDIARALGIDRKPSSNK